MTSNPFDPRFWVIDETATVTIDTYGDLFATVSRIDLPMLRAFKTAWCLKPERNTAYARTTVTLNGRRVGLYMHRLIMLATGIEPPTVAHTIVDHRDGDGLNNTRENLRWSTPRDNRLNVGSYRENLDMFRELWHQRRA